MRPLVHAVLCPWSVEPQQPRPSQARAAIRALWEVRHNIHVSVLPDTVTLADGSERALGECAGVALSAASGKDLVEAIRDRAEASLVWGHLSTHPLFPASTGCRKGR